MDSEESKNITNALGVGVFPNTLDFFKGWLYIELDKFYLVFIISSSP